MLCLIAVAEIAACACASTQAAVPSPAESPSSPPAQVACSLPYLPTGGFNPFNAVGFLKLPEGVFRPDSSATSNLPPGGVQASPTYAGNQPWWDAQARRWVPVPLSSVSPDGQGYAYLGADGLHRVVVATAADSLVYARPPGVLGGDVLGYLGGDVYIVFPAGVKNGSGGAITNPPAEVGVWRIDETGKGTQIRTSDVVGSMAGGALWITPTSGYTLGDSLVRIDLSSGQQTVWFSDPGQMIQFLGVDAMGLPIVWTFNGAGHLDIWHVDAPGKAKVFYSLDYAGAPHIFGPEWQHGLLVADAHGVWFGASDGLWLYDGSVFKQVSTVSGIPAGPCQ